MLDEDFARQLANSPQPKSVVNQLFSKARANSEQRFFCAIIDLHRDYKDGNKEESVQNSSADSEPNLEVDRKSYLVCEIMRSSVIQQFAEYFSQVIIPLPDCPDPQTLRFVRRLQMLAYSQFWECLGIQRLL